MEDIARMRGRGETTREVDERPSLVGIPALRVPAAVELTLIPGAVGDPTTSVPSVKVGPFRVADGGAEAVTRAIVDGAVATRAKRVWTAYALHVNGLNNWRDEEFVHAMAESDIIYADGASVVVLARLAGAPSVTRASTTDIGWDVLVSLSQALERPVRVALIGGPPGLSIRAARVLEDRARVRVVFAEHGCHDDWSGVLHRLAGIGCDVLLVGMGTPLEMKWVERHRSTLPACLVVTCGGWFGFITSDERRAPAFLRRLGQEWVYRVAQSPRRLAGRYTRGILISARFATTISAQRLFTAIWPGGPLRPGSDLKGPGARRQDVDAG